MQLMTVRVQLPSNVEETEQVAAAEGAVGDVYRRVGRLSEPGGPLAGSLQPGSECTVVYHSCGSCMTLEGQRGYFIEYFCTGGGSQPDYSECEPC